MAADANAPDAVADTMRAMYAAATADDFARLKEIFTEDFYAFDLGKRFDGMALAELIKGAHEAGTAFVWTVNDPETHVIGDWAWITYVNRGSITNASGVTPVTWLESAVLVHDAGRWRIRFFHSTRVPQE
jgi:ketosteroid isomerase-like protein